MNKLAILPLCLGCIFASATAFAVDVKQSKVTQVVNDVQIISAADQKQKNAVLNDVFAMPDILRTGPASRAELVAQDQTVTRVGANTIFSFDPANRTIDLKQGSLLFHSPHGKGGGTIHTGSATASVLGSTLIVVTTPNGGMKVIALEDEVEVKFLNGLKQKLAPGQMTFVLPGANQLAPVIIFRLDELTQNSLLVKGFTQPLASLPLVQNEVEKQLKLIRSGRIADTGLLAGENAGPDQVEVLDINTIPHDLKIKKNSAPPPPNVPPTPPPSNPNLAAALGADATINQSSLLDASIPTPPIHLLPGTAFSLDNEFFGAKKFTGFVARNIFVNTLGLDNFNVNLKGLSGPNGFDMVAVNDFNFDGSASFRGLTAQEKVSLYAGNQFNFAPGISIEADANNFLLSSPATLLFDNVTLLNKFRDITLNSGNDVILQNNSLVNVGQRFIVNAVNDVSVTDSHLVGNSATLSSLSGSVWLDNTTVDASSHTTLIAPMGINVNNSTINSDFITLNGTTLSTVSVNNSTLNAHNDITAISATDLNITGDSGEVEIPSVAAHSVRGGSELNVDPESGSVNLITIAGSINVSDTSIQAHFLTLNSGDGILLDGSGHSFTASGEGSTAKFTAPNLITVNNADLTSYSVVNMAANTINLSDVAFGAGSSVTLKSLLGMLNVGSSVPGYVNFINNVTYGGNPAQNYVNNGGGITVTTLH